MKCSSNQQTKTEAEVTVFEFNLELFRIYNHTIAWAERCVQHADVIRLNGEVLIVLDMIGIEGSATLYQLNIIMDSNHNVNTGYILKKLLKMDLIKPNRSDHSARSISYQISKEGKKYLKAYINIRSKMISEMFGSYEIKNLVNLTQSLRQIRSHYVNSIETFSGIK